MKKAKQKKTMDKYEYKVVWSEEDQVYIGRVAEFPSLAAHGDTSETALREIQFVVSEVLEDMQEQGEILPSPLSIKKYSGKLNVRMPEYLHRQLASEATWQNVSLNQLIVSKLARNVRQPFRQDEVVGQKN